MTNPQNNMNMIQSFIEFRNNFTGNPQAELMKLIRQGKINQDQLNQLQNMGKQFVALMNSMK